MPHAVQRCTRSRVPQLGPIAQREQRLAATRCLSGPGNRQHFVRVEISLASPTRRGGERAIVADITAQPGQRNEHLA